MFYMTSSATISILDSDRFLSIDVYSILKAFL
jgi:hypothetical protein